MQLYGISFMHPYKQSGQWQDVPDHKTACTSLPEDEHLDVQNMLKTP